MHCPTEDQPALLKGWSSGLGLLLQDHLGACENCTVVGPVLGSEASEPGRPWIWSWDPPGG